MTTHRTGERTLPAELQARLDHLRGLTQNWDSYGAEPISPMALSLARKVLCRSIATLEERGAPNIHPFTIAPLSDGGVHVEWRSRGGFVEIEIGPSGALSALVGNDGPSSAAREEHPNISLEDVPAMLVAMA